jgi:hypothetical protein
VHDHGGEGAQDHGGGSLQCACPAVDRPFVLPVDASSPSAAEGRPVPGAEGEPDQIHDHILKPVRVADLENMLRSVPLPRTEPMPAPTTDAGSPPADQAHAVPPGSESDARPPAVDLDVLHRLSADMGADSPDGRQMLIDAYLEQAGGWVGDLLPVAQRGDRERIRMIAHTLASSSALLGAHRLAELLSESGRVARTDGPPGSSELVEAARQVTAEYARVAALLEGIRSSRLEPGEDRP